VWFIALEVRAADEGQVLRMRAEVLASEGQCEQAIEKARAARRYDPGDAKAALIEGRCLLNLKRYDEAVAAFEAARGIDAGYAGLSLDLAAAYYHTGDLDASRRALEHAEAESPDEPRVSLYRGLLLLEQSQDAQAAAAFERASRMDPAIDPLASYYAGLAWERAREREQARAALEGVRDRSPSSPWAEEAGSALERLDQREAADVPHYWAQLSIGGEWDSNVVLRGDGIDLPPDISDDEDGRGIWSAEVGAELFNSENYAGGVIAGYHGNRHVDLEEFDLRYPSASLWLDRRIDDRSFVRLQPYGGYAWVDESEYLGQGGATLSYHRNFDERGAGRLYSQVTYRDYLFRTGLLPAAVQPLDDELDRDGWDFLGGYDHVLPLDDQTSLRAGVAFGHYEAEGAEYSHQTYGGQLGLRRGLPFEFVLDLEGAYAYQPYRNESVFSLPVPQTGPERRDQLFGTRVALERRLLSWLSVTAHWRYQNNESNVRVFDYDRHILGGYFARSALGITLLVLGLGWPAAALAGESVGQVTSAAGEVVAIAADGSERTLGCGDPIYAGDRLATGAGANVGVLSGDYLTQLPDSSRVLFGQTASGAPDATLERGKVRIIDVREGGGTARLAAADAAVRVVGNDAEAYLLSEKVGGYAMFCEWDAPLDVVRRDEQKLADPEQCIIAKPHEPLYVADAHEERIAAGPVETCPPDLGALASTDPHFSPIASRDVAAPPPPLVWSSLPDAPGPPGRNPCELPGSVCGFVAGAPPTGIIVVDEPVPGLGPRDGSPIFTGAN
jgi:tetratricopeptide (TPR) repeat protein